MPPKPRSDGGRATEAGRRLRNAGDPPGRAPCSRLAVTRHGAAQNPRIASSAARAPLPGPRGRTPGPFWPESRSRSTVGLGLICLRYCTLAWRYRASATRRARPVHSPIRPEQLERDLGNQGQHDAPQATNPLERGPGPPSRAGAARADSDADPVRGRHWQPTPGSDSDDYN